jgi:chemotaxis protein CheD
MKQIIAQHSWNAFLKPGEVIISADPVIVSTVLGSCVAVTMYSPKKHFGAICHAMLPSNPNEDANLLYVNTAIHYIYRKMMECGPKEDLVIKLFGGAQVLVDSTKLENRRIVGEMNIVQAQKVLTQLGLKITRSDIGGTLGRKLFFSIKTGDVYMRKLKMEKEHSVQGAKS